MACGAFEVLDDLVLLDRWMVRPSIAARKVLGVDEIPLNLGRHTSAAKLRQIQYLHKNHRQA